MFNFKLKMIDGIAGNYVGNTVFFTSSPIMYIKK